MIGAVARRKKARSEKSFWRSSSEFGKAEVQDQRRNRGTVGFADVNNLRSQILDLRSVCPYFLLMKIVPIPLPTPFYIGPVNVYLIAEDPVTLIDTGPKTKEALEALHEGLRR